MTKAIARVPPHPPLGLGPGQFAGLILLFSDTRLFLFLNTECFPLPYYLDVYFQKDECSETEQNVTISHQLSHRGFFIFIFFLQASKGTHLQYVWYFYKQVLG